MLDPSPEPEPEPPPQPEYEEVQESNDIELESNVCYQQNVTPNLEEAYEPVDYNGPYEPVEY